VYYKKKHTDRSVWDAALERTHEVYDRYDYVEVSFSGGKDSTVALNMAIEVARERDELPVNVIYFDEEVVPPDTDDYVRRVYNRDEVNMRWVCYPMRFVNGANKNKPYWTTWNPDKRDVWCRNLPDEGDANPPEGWHHQTHKDANDVLFDADWGRSCVILGLRADESLNRYRSVASKLEDNFITRDQNAHWVDKASPVYDWKYGDIWKAVNENGWDYNKTYDKLTMAGVAPADQRVSQPFNDTALTGLWEYRTLYPEFWDKMLARLPGVNTALKYADSTLYGKKMSLYDGTADDYKEAIENMLQEYDESERKRWAQKIQGAIRLHYKKTNDELPVTGKHEYTGLSWQVLLKIAVQGDKRDNILSQVAV